MSTKANVVAITAKIKTAAEGLEQESNNFTAKGVKASVARARAFAQELSVLTKEFRKAIQEAKVAE